MVKRIKHATLENLPFWIFAGISAGIGIASCIFPPPGEIHKSILQFIAWMFAFCSLWVVYKAFNAGVDAKFQKGDLSMTLGNHDKEEPIATSEENIEQDDV